MLPRLLLQLVLPEQGLSEGRDVRLASCQQGSALKDQRSYELQEQAGEHSTRGNLSGSAFSSNT
jgi:hypothetical protein